VPAEVLLVSAQLPSGGGVIRYDAVTGAAIDQLRTVDSSDAGRLAVRENDGALYQVFPQVIQRVTPAFTADWTISATSSTFTSATIVANTNNLLLVGLSNGSFSVYKSDTGTPFNVDQGAGTFQTVRDITVVPGTTTAYALGAARTTGSPLVEQYHIDNPNDGTLSNDQAFLQGGAGESYGGIAATYTGLIVVADTGRGTVRFFDRNKSERFTVAVPKLSGPIAVGNNVSLGGAQVLFVLTEDGIRRVTYGAGTAALYDDDTRGPFITPPPSVSFKALAFRSRPN
jgi:hypothetical protein